MPTTQRVGYVRVSSAGQNLARQLEAIGDVDKTYRVDAIMTDAPQHGWRPLYQERYPHAGGPDHYAGWLENSAGFKAEVVADGS